jgi:hypothetical protein
MCLALVSCNLGVFHRHDSHQLRSWFTCMHLNFALQLVVQLQAVKVTIWCEPQSTDGCKGYHELQAVCQPQAVTAGLRQPVLPVLSWSLSRMRTMYTVCMTACARCLWACWVHMTNQTVGLPVAQQLWRRQVHMAYALWAYHRCYSFSLRVLAGLVCSATSATWHVLFPENLRRCNPCMCLCTLGGFVLQSKHANCMHILTEC